MKQKCIERRENQEGLTLNCPLISTFDTGDGFKVPV